MPWITVPVRELRAGDEFGHRPSGMVVGWIALEDALVVSDGGVRIRVQHLARRQAGARAWEDPTHELDIVRPHPWRVESGDPPS